MQETATRENWKVYKCEMNHCDVWYSHINLATVQLLRLCFIHPYLLQLQKFFTILFRYL
jgi:hypothetical protein